MSALPPKPASLEHISDAHWEAAFEEVARRAGYGGTGVALRHLSTKGKNGAADYARCLILLGEVDEPEDPIDAAIKAVWDDQWNAVGSFAESARKHFSGLKFPVQP